ncbi:MAG: hypothetical protein A3H88_00995 [Candidatus Blackburnbacteria bacterium RIFCSPLOWO2_02_FULL_44_9]|uniref:Uncharacterized protein n=1 Tax=Candidatus Blackburnbacteria bacterium RIFCSPHIGHO2_02_FULL_44_20 TaxID=1797516 RepID=A0A1G1V9C0_9BACT|nr:MAG: hypothetical protein A3E16_00905 [Candidatus Blackburnbacteria bacterium RIFCSPHIGHO2_12_FULL_44_25]OGY11953.1 MAG: hypothetical protein A3D26_03110 [Candidatus Blackburnbacteria bacterium RIFCSPHIGHO2_02_FULL_44_20]OGY14513.1 MAG: hypothetical protein A3A62_02260 [Candidatus Blackburnbacteria bacterium RIFCSPLOWO2_01_FULL_44_43]OGY15959.1 MAG: hypothetical protein A3H88_00995 [Candidatus Blackburnbacteria bacterium RIFCSPLOWO2_02_FULL_44_9]
MVTLVELEVEVEKIKERNRRVEADKDWETSKTRIVFISSLTFVLLYLFLRLSDQPLALLKALVATVLYWVSTESYGMLKKWWLKRRHH